MQRSEGQSDRTATLVQHLQIDTKFFGGFEGHGSKCLVNFHDFHLRAVVALLRQRGADCAGRLRVQVHI